jgi:hypothetical protein
LAGQIKVDSINADSNLALKIANTAVAFIDSSGLRPISGNVNLDATATSKLYLPSANTVAIQTAGVTGLSISSSQVVTLANALAVTSGGTGVTTSTGTGSVVLSASPTFTGNVTTPLSYVRLNSANGYGSTNTVIRRFTNIVNNVGTDITYADSATLGGTFTINTAGVYSVSYSDQFNASSWLGLSFNSTQLTTSILSISVTDILSASTTSGVNLPATTSSTFYAAAATVIRAHTQGTASGSNPRGEQFTIARVQ